MAVSNTKDLLIKATGGRYSVGAFNVTNIVQMAAVVDAASELSSPVIIQTSVSPAMQLGPELFSASYRSLAESVDIPVALQLDHCTDIDFCKRCIDAGYTSIMIDASGEKLEENIRITSAVVKYAGSDTAVSIEGELGTVGGVEDQVRVSMSEVELCDPETAVRFVEETGLDNLAPAIGTAHGIYKTENPVIDVARLKRISERLNGKNILYPLVVHGGSGLSRDVVRALVAAGGAKFNVSTELKLAWINGAREYLKGSAKEYNPVKMNQVQIDSTKELIRSWINLLGNSGKGQIV